VPTLPAELTTILVNPEPLNDGWLRLPRIRQRQK